MRLKEMIKCSPSKTNDKFIASCIVPTNPKEKESDELFYTARSLVKVRGQLPAQVVR